MFKQFALDIKDWSPWIRVAAIDCASESSIEGEDNGKEICHQQPYLITSMPDIRFYAANTKKVKNNRDNNPGVKRVLNLSTIQRGTIELWDGTNVFDLRKMALEFASNKLSKNLVHFKPIKPADADELVENRGESNLVIFIERRSSLVMKTAQMDLAGFSNIIIRRMNLDDQKTAEFLDKFEIDLDSCFILFGGDSDVPIVGKLPGFGVRGFLRETLRSLPRVTPPEYERLEFEPENDEISRLAEYQATLKPADQETVYMQDLESALYYMIKKEAAAKDEYTPEENQTIRDLLNLLGNLRHVRKP